MWLGKILPRRKGHRFFRIMKGASRFLCASLWEIARWPQAGQGDEAGSTGRRYTLERFHNTCSRFRRWNKVGFS